MASANGWKRPNGPTRFGPNLPWIFATTRRSIRVIYAKAVSSAKMTMAPLMTEATTMLLRNSSMGLRARQRAQRMPNCLHMMVNIRHAAVFFRKGDRGQHYIGPPGCLCQRNILHDQVFKLRRKLRNVPCRVRAHHV